MLTHVQLPPLPQLLLVDDSPVNLDLLNHHLRERDYICVTASNGVHAWELLEQEPERFSAVVLDLMMPEMDGFEFVAQLRQKDQWRRVPVVVVTAKDLTTEDKLRLDGHVKKIFQKGSLSREELAHQIRSVLSSAPRPAA